MKQETNPQSAKIVEGDKSENELSELRTKATELIKKESQLLAKEQDLQELELQALNGFPLLLEEKFKEVKKQLKEREKNYSEEWQSIESEKERLHKWQGDLKKAETERDAGFVDEKQKVVDELDQQRKTGEDELVKFRQKRFAELNDAIEQERAERLTSLTKELSENRQSFSDEKKKILADLQAQREDLTQKKAKLAELEDELEYQRKKLKSAQDRLDERDGDIDEEVDRKIKERKKSFDKEIAQSQDECERLRDSSVSLQELLNVYENLKKNLGDEPEKILLKLETQLEELIKLRTDLAERPSEEMRIAFDSMLCHSSE